MEENVVYDLNQEPIVLSKSIIDMTLKTENPSDCLALYTFLYYTAKWQKTNTVKATTSYIMDAFKWGNRRVSKTKKILKSLGLIKNVKRNSLTNKGWFIEIKFIWSQETTQKNINSDTESVDYNTKNKRCAKTHIFEDVRNETSSFQDTNALSTNIRNALSVGRELKTLRSTIPPQKNLVIRYFESKNYKSNPEKFLNHYNSVNWRKGKSKITDWIALANLWESNEREIQSKKQTVDSVELFNHLKRTAV